MDDALATRDDQGGRDVRARRAYRLWHSRVSYRHEGMLVTDLGHFLDLPDDVPGPARRLAEQLSLIVRAATAVDPGFAWVSALPCRRRPGRRACPGHVGVCRTDVPASIEWWCTSCDDAGMISGWERSPFDLRPRNPECDATDPALVTIPAEVAATLRSLRLLDSASERIVFRACATERGIVLAADEDDLDELAGFIAAETNHEPDRGRQKRLDVAFAVLNDAIARLDDA